MYDFVHGVRSNVRRIGVKIEQKRPCTLCSKYYYMPPPMLKNTASKARHLRNQKQIDIILEKFAYYSFYNDYLFFIFECLSLDAVFSLFFNLPFLFLFCNFFFAFCISAFSLLSSLLWFHKHGSFSVHSLVNTIYQSLGT